MSSYRDSFGNTDSPLDDPEGLQAARDAEQDERAEHPERYGIAVYCGACGTVAQFEAPTDEAPYPEHNCALDTWTGVPAQRPLYNCLTCGEGFTGPTAADAWMAHTVPSCAKQRRNESDARLAVAAIRHRDLAREKLVTAFGYYLATDHADLQSAIDALAGYCEDAADKWQPFEYERWQMRARLLAALAEEIGKEGL